MELKRLEHCEPFITLDGSEIRELAGVPAGNAANQSLAQATVPPGGRTEAHFHRASEELYLFTAGAGRMVLGEEEEAAVRAGDCVVIPPGTAHQLVNDGDEPLVLLCCCAPPYSDADTVIVRSRVQAM